MSEDEELAALRAKRKGEIEQQAAAQDQQVQYDQQVEQQRRRAMIGILSDKALDRLSNIKLVNPEFAATIENQLLTIAQSGRLKEKITDQQLKTMLKQLQSSKRERKIKTVRK